MIIFTPIQNIPVEYLEYKCIRQVVKYNLSSYYNDAPTLEALIPTPNCIPSEVILGDATDPSFDIEYHNYIINNQNPFMEFMSIIIPAYTSPDTLVQVMIRASNFRDVITESLLKLIQQRYGYNACIVNELDDFIYTIESDFSIPGLFALDQDLQRWRSVMHNPYDEVNGYE
jgi:hypothetical protein